MGEDGVELGYSGRSRFARLTAMLVDFCDNGTIEGDIHQGADVWVSG